MYFNGVTQDDFEQSAAYGIDSEFSDKSRCTKLTKRPVWVENGGIVGRGVLLDWGAWVKARGDDPDLLATTSLRAGVDIVAGADLWS